MEVLWGKKNPLFALSVACFFEIKLALVHDHRFTCVIICSMCIACLPLDSKRHNDKAQDDA